MNDEQSLRTHIPNGQIEELPFRLRELAKLAMVSGRSYRMSIIEEQCLLHGIDLREVTELARTTLCTLKEAYDYVWQREQSKSAGPSFNLGEITEEFRKCFADLL